MNRDREETRKDIEFAQQWQAEGEHALKEESRINELRAEKRFFISLQYHFPHTRTINISLYAICVMGFYNPSGVPQTLVFLLCFGLF